MSQTWANVTHLEWRRPAVAEGLAQDDAERSPVVGRRRERADETHERRRVGAPGEKRSGSRHPGECRPPVLAAADPWPIVVVVADRQRFSGVLDADAGLLAGPEHPVEVLHDGRATEKRIVRNSSAGARSVEVDRNPSPRKA